MPNIHNSLWCAGVHVGNGEGKYYFFFLFYLHFHVFFFCLFSFLDLKGGKVSRCVGRWANRKVAMWVYMFRHNCQTLGKEIKHSGFTSGTYRLVLGLK